MLGWGRRLLVWKLSRLDLVWCFKSVGFWGPDSFKAFSFRQWSAYLFSPTVLVCRYKADGDQLQPSKLEYKT
ncbi:MAG: hypothetical protein ACKERG_01015 [Candidatus Hodgkinia cicadicola]